MGAITKLCAGAGVLGAALLFALAVVAGGFGASAEQGTAPSVLGQLDQEVCVPVGPVPTLTSAQATNAETIVAAAETLEAGERGAQIALMVAYTRIVAAGPRTTERQRGLARPLPTTRDGRLGHRGAGAGPH